MRLASHDIPNSVLSPVRVPSRGELTHRTRERLRSGYNPTPRQQSHGRPAPRARIALYSHDAMGLGHIRRNLLIAQTLADQMAGATILMVAGADEATAFAMPHATDCLALPALHKDSSGRYSSRSLALTLDELAALRSRTIRAALEAFEPDVLIVDKLPRGIACELDPTLQHLRERGRTRLVLGLRDILDDPATVRREWQANVTEEAIRRFYDAVWVYGDPRVYDMVSEYSLPADIASKVHYTGYLDQSKRMSPSENPVEEPLLSTGALSDKLVLCLVGGGQDGERLAEAFAHSTMPAGTTGLIVTGPCMPRSARERLHAQVAANTTVRMVEFSQRLDLLLARADRVVAMGGYNTVGEILAYEKTALIVPRVTPRVEQLIRAQRLRDLGLLDMLHPDELSPRAITEWLAADKPKTAVPCEKIDLGGLARLPHLLNDLQSVSGGAYCTAQVQPGARPTP